MWLPGHHLSGKVGFPDMAFVIDRAVIPQNSGTLHVLIMAHCAAEQMHDKLHDRPPHGILRLESLVVENPHYQAFALSQFTPGFVSTFF